jgi:hypothetical protein
MPSPFGDTHARPPRRLIGALKAGATCANATAIAEYVAIPNKGDVRARIKATVGGTLSMHYMGPDVDVAAGTGTEYTTGNPTDVTVTANTEAMIDTGKDTDAHPIGEGYVKVIYTPSGSGTITFCDVSIFG